MSMSDNGHKAKAMMLVREAWVTFRDSGRAENDKDVRTSAILAVFEEFGESILDMGELSAIRDGVMIKARKREEPLGARPFGVR